jgi:hypothetical protein
MSLLMMDGLLVNFLVNLLVYLQVCCLQHHLLDCRQLYCYRQLHHQIHLSTGHTSLISINKEAQALHPSYKR